MAEQILNIALVGVMLITAGTMDVAGLPLGGIVATVGLVAVFVAKVMTEAWG